MKYVSSIFNGMKVIARVKVIVRAFNGDADAKARATCMTLAPWTFVPAC